MLLKNERYISKDQGWFNSRCNYVLAILANHTLKEYGMENYCISIVIKKQTNKNLYSKNKNLLYLKDYTVKV